MSKNLISLLLLVCSMHVIAQDIFNKTDTNIIPPSPEVASLGKYIDTPVNNYTGVPRIEIPIYTIEEGSIRVPISLSYHASGIKVEEIASRVGLGWTLMAGGMITRQMRGLPDFHDYGYMDPKRLTVEEFTQNSNIKDTQNENYDFISYETFQYSQNKIDFEPDVFAFTFMGYSGKFYFDQKTGKAILTEDVPLKITGSENGFSITTPDGLRYSFGSGENTKQIHPGYDPNTILTLKNGGSSSNVDETDVVYGTPSYVSAWYLSSIYDPISEERITFKYDATTLRSTLQRVNETRLVALPASGYTFIPYTWHVFNIEETNEIFLTEIEFENGTIEFTYDTTERQDLRDSNALKEIEVFNLNNKLIKSFALDHFYTENSNMGSNMARSEIKFRDYNDQTDFRLFLSGLKEYEINNINNTKITNTFKSHQFQYYSPQLLPNRFSTAQDWWGYYNGASSNENLIPLSYLSGNEFIGEANRHVDKNRSKYGALRKIIYPTGGEKEFIYENNTIYGAVHSDSWIFTPPPPTGSNFLVTYDQDDTEYYNPDEYQPTYEIPFTVETSIVPGTSSRIPITFNYENNNNGRGNGDANWQLCLRKTNGELVFCTDKSSHTHTSYLDEGDYYFLLEFDEEHANIPASDSPEFDDWSISFNLYDIDEDSIDPVFDGYGAYGGGLRIKEIKSRTEDQTISTFYDYTNDDGNSSGNLATYPFYLADRSIGEYRTGSGQPGFYSIRHYSSNSSIPLAQTQGSYTGYEKVTITTTGDEYGKTEYYYSSALDQFFYDYPYDISPLSPVQDKSPLVPMKSAEIERGKLLREVTYAYKDNEFVKQKEATNAYELTTHNEQQAYYIRHYKKPSSAIGAVLCGYIYCSPYEIGIVGDYTLYSKTNVLTESTNVFFDTNGENPITTLTRYKYENNQFPSLQTGSVTTNSKGAILENKIYYPDQVTGTTHLEGGSLSSPEYAAIQRLQSDGSEYRVEQPIQQETYVDGGLTTIQRTNFSTTNSLTLPSAVEAIYEDGNLEERLTYHSYDAYGNPLEVSKPDGSHTIYIWGYNDQYPIAKIENASYEGISDAASTKIASIKAASNIEDTAAEEDGLRQLFDYLRDDAYFQNAMITSYTYDPLVGVTSVTDPKEYTTYYEYDGFQRLETVKDAKGHLLSKNEYNYKN